MEKRKSSSTNSNNNETNSYGVVPVSRLGKLEKGKDPAVIIFNGTLCPIHAGKLYAYELFVQEYETDQIAIFLTF
jgi:hypothetical protein